MDREFLPWDAPQFREKKDSDWTAGCRWQQSWWRDQRGFPPGAVSQSNDRIVCSSLPQDVPAEANFYGINVVGAVDDFILHGEDTPLPVLDQLFRNLLSSQAACFNLFGEFKAEPKHLLDWVRSVDPDASAVSEIRFVWTPDKKLHFSGSTTFDALIDYGAGAARRFLGVTCVYADDLADSTTKIRPGHVEFTATSGLWRDGADRRLDRAQLRPLWLNTVVGQSLVDKGGYDAGRVVVMACAADQNTLGATNLVRGELVDPDASLVWSPFESVVDAVGAARPKWAVWFRQRYLDFTPVLHLLADDDPRRGGAAAAGVTGLKELAAVGPQIFGSKKALDLLIKGVAKGTVDAAAVSALDDRARELAVDLRAFRESLGELGL